MPTPSTTLALQPIIFKKFPYSAAAPTLLPRLRPYKWLRYRIEVGISNGPFSTVTVDNDLAIVVNFDFSEKLKVYVSAAWLHYWGKSGKELHQDSLKNLYAKTRLPMQYSFFSRLTKDEPDPGSYFTLRFMDYCDPQRLLLPFLLMPLKRRLDVMMLCDIVVLVQCNEAFVISDTNICGSKDVKTLDQLKDTIE
ncbi:hypothetical protein HK098_001210 [Nowakowskiella sp. JEL0407]|nr:hypothetical protein HK098_001210 [Nowakowskiella sp. JEL0407]